MISVFCDGSSDGASNNPGGYGFVILRENQILAQGHGGEPSTTNNRQELQAAISGLSFLEASNLLLPNEPVELVSDSKYCLNLAVGIYKPSTNFDLVERLQILAKNLKICTRWVRGHAGNQWNEACDILAKTGKENGREKSFVSEGLIKS